MNQPLKYKELSAEERKKPSSDYEIKLTCADKRRERLIEEYICAHKYKELEHRFYSMCQYYYDACEKHIYRVDSYCNEATVYQEPVFEKITDEKVVASLMEWNPRWFP
jgi:hypothetical protein